MTPIKSGHERKFSQADESPLIDFVRNSYDSRGQEPSLQVEELTGLINNGSGVYGSPPKQVMFNVTNYPHGENQRKYDLPFELSQSNINLRDASFSQETFPIPPTSTDNRNQKSFNFPLSTRSTKTLNVATPSNQQQLAHT